MNDKQLLISSWLMLSQELFRKCFRRLMTLSAKDIPAAGEHPKLIHAVEVG